jgi:hypothetical protein
MECLIALGRSCRHRSNATQEQPQSYNFSCEVFCGGRPQLGPKFRGILSKRAELGMLQTPPEL